MANSADRRVVAPDKRKLRNLVQYRDMDDDEFDKIFDETYLSDAEYKQQRESFEEEIQRKIDEFGEDYDLSDLKINDRETLRALVQAILSLEAYELYIFRERNKGDLTMDNILIFDKVNKVMSDLRSDISKLQGDLKITRKIRKGDKTESVLQFMDEIKDKARRFYESRMLYVTCPKCNQLIFTGWFLYPKEKNKITLTCNRFLDDNGEVCGNTFSITSEDLLKNKGFNDLEVIPEGMK